MFKLGKGKILIQSTYSYSTVKSYKLIPLHVMTFPSITQMNQNHAKYRFDWSVTWVKTFASDLHRKSILCTVNHYFVDIPYGSIIQ